ncbi:pseudouridine synthase [Camelimonas fluminis]|nr:pseudouridine synthase [Camelimonas fluminis]
MNAPGAMPGPMGPALLETADLTTESAGRLDKLLADAFPDLSRSRLQQVVRAGGVSVDGVVVAAPSAKVKAGARIALQIPEAEPARPVARAIPLDILHEDDALIVINKAAGMVVHPAAGHHDDTLVNALLAHCGDSLSGIGGVRRPGIVHRLDKDTSGVMVVAKTDQAHQALSAQFADHGRTGPLRRAYLAIAWGAPSLPRFTIRKPLARSVHNREKIVVVGEDQGREAITHVSALRSWSTQTRKVTEPVASLLRCELETGRTHQIRVHLAAQGHPLLGDALYGAGFMSRAAKLTPAARDALEQLGRQALHAEMLGFAHPVTGTPMSFEAPPPADLQRLLRALDEAGA